MILATVFTLVIYVTSMLLFRNYFDTSFITINFVWKILAISLLAWLPMHLTKVIYECIDVPEHKKILAGRSY